MSKDIAVKNISSLNLEGGYSSITAEDKDSQKVIYTAISNAEKLSDNLNTPIHLVDVITMPVSELDEESGEVDEYTRTSLIAADGKAFAAGSNGVLSSLKNLFGVFGTPDTWTEPLAIQVVEKKGKKGKFFTIEVL